MPFYPTPEPRRRLRHHRLLRRRPAARRLRRLRRGHPHRERPRHARHRRPGRQPHLRPAPVVPLRARRPRLAVPRLLRVARRAAEDPAGQSSRQGEPATGSGREGRPVLPAPLLPLQPDLNITDPAVRDEIAKIMGFWLRSACPVSGWTPCRSCCEDGRAPSDADPDDRMPSCGPCGRCRPPPRGRDAARRGQPRPRDRTSSSAGQRRRAAPRSSTSSSCSACSCRWPAASRAAGGPDPPPAESAARQRWATFVRNHDELTLDKLSDAEREEVFAAFGPEEDMRIYGARACAAARRRCSAATGRGCAWPGRCVLAARAPRCCSTATRSGWGGPRAGGPHGRAGRRWTGSASRAAPLAGLADAASSRASCTAAARRRSSARAPAR